MDKLTFIDGCGNSELKCCMECGSGCGASNENCGNCEKPHEAYARLAAYEDTGLEPEQIEALKTENKRINDFMNTDCARLLEKLGRVEGERDAAIADLELGHLPCGACVSRPSFRDEGKCAQCIHSNWATKAKESHFEWRGKDATSEQI